MICMLYVMYVSFFLMMYECLCGLMDDVHEVGFLALRSFDSLLTTPKKFFERMLRITTTAKDFT